MAIDRPSVSIILNLHREGRLVGPALRSLERAAAMARFAGVATDLVVVFDAADDLTIEAATPSPEHFRSVEKLCCNERSLGLARNVGINAAVGDYIATADGDDIVSSNYIVDMLKAAARHPGPAFVFPECLVCFGGVNYIQKLHGLDEVGTARLFMHHPFVSRFMGRRKELLPLLYRDHASGDRYAYEDYELNLRAVAAGYDMVIAPGTALFYRVRDDGIMAGLEGAGALLPRFNDFYRFETFFARARTGLPAADAPASADLAQLFGSTTFRRMVEDAHAIEPDIDAAVLADATIETNLSLPPHVGDTYRTISETLRGQDFTDIVLIETVADDARMRALNQTLDLLADAQGRQRRVLFVIVGSFGRSSADPSRRQLKLGLDPVDLSLPAVELLVVRIIQNYASGVIVHAAPSAFCLRLAAQFRQILAPSLFVLHPPAKKRSWLPVHGVATKPSLGGFDLVVVADAAARVTWRTEGPLAAPCLTMAEFNDLAAAGIEQLHLAIRQPIQGA